MAIYFVINEADGKSFSMKIASLEESVRGWPEAMAGKKPKWFIGITPLGIEPQDLPEWLAELEILTQAMESEPFRARYPESAERMKDFAARLRQLTNRSGWSAYIG